MERENARSKESAPDTPFIVMRKVVYGKETLTVERKQPRRELGQVAPMIIRREGCSASGVVIYNVKTEKASVGFPRLRWWERSGNTHGGGPVSKIEFFVVRVGEWGGHMLVDCDDP